MMFEELKCAQSGAGVGGFLPAVKQIANVASLPGIVGASVALPDVHSGYGFAIGNVAACQCASQHLCRGYMHARHGAGLIAQLWIADEIERRGCLATAAELPVPARSPTHTRAP